jgi:ribosome-associated protein
MKIDTELLHQELKFRTSRASGSGGQHVNKVETRVELLFDVDGSPLLSDPQKKLLHQRLHSRINKEGTLIIASQTHRSQVRNKEEAIAKFDELIQRALKPRPKRKKVKRLTSNPKKRLQAKKRQSEKKAKRKKVNPWD